MFQDGGESTRTRLVRKGTMQQRIQQIGAPKLFVLRLPVSGAYISSFAPLMSSPDAHPARKRLHRQFAMPQKEANTLRIGDLRPIDKDQTIRFITRHLRIRVPYDVHVCLPGEFVCRQRYGSSVCSYSLLRTQCSR